MNPKVLPAPLLATVTAIALCVVFPALMWNLGSPLEPPTELVLTATLVLAGARFTWIVGSRVRHLHEMVLWLFVYVFMGLAPLAQFRVKFPGTTPFLDLSLSLEAALIVLFGCVAILLGSALASRRATAVIDAGDAAPRFNISARNTYIWTFVALLAAGAFIARVGPGSLFAARADLKASQADALGSDPLGTLLSAIARMGLVVAFVALMHVRAQRKLAGARPPILLPVVTLITLFMVVNPISSARYTFGTALLAVLGALGAYATVKRFRVVALGAMVGVVMVFPILDTFRRTLDTTVQLENPVDSITTGDFDAFAQVINTVQYTASQGFEWGWQLLGVLFFWVPRSVWPGKPIDTGVAIAEFKGYGFTNLSAPFWAELFINFGWLGLILGMIALGYLLRRLDARAEVALRIAALPGVMACITPFYMLILLRGSLLQAMVTLFVILGASWFVSRPAKKAGASRDISRPTPAYDSATA